MNNPGTTSIAPSIRKLRAAAAVLRERATQVSRQRSHHPRVVEATLTDAYALTFLVAAPATLTQVVAEIAKGPTSNRTELAATLRYRRGRRHLLLATLMLDDPIEPGSRIRLSADGQEIRSGGALVRVTDDDTYPLIDQLWLLPDGDGWLIEAGVPTEVVTPGLLAVNELEGEPGLVLSLDTQVDGFGLTVQQEQRYARAVDGSTDQLRLTAQELAHVAPEPGGGSVLARIRVDVGERLGLLICYPDQWVRAPRYYQSYRPVTILIDGRPVVVRPYWTLSHRLGLKLANGA